MKNTFITLPEVSRKCRGAPTGTPRKKDANDVRAKDLQAILLWKPTDRFTMKTKAWFFSTDQDYLNVMNSVDPLVDQFVHAKADGPVPFQYPGPSVAEDFGGGFTA